MHIILNYDKIYDDGQYSIMLPRLDYIKQARLKLGVTQRKLAFLCGVNFPSMINQIESGRCKPTTILLNEYLKYCYQWKVVCQLKQEIFVIKI